MLNREKIYALSGSIIGCVLLFLILWFITMPVFHTDNVLDEGVMISFGDALDGGGNDMSVQDVYVPPAAGKTEQTSQKLPSEQDLLTQKNESPIKIPEKKDKTDKKTQDLEQQQQADQQRKAAQQQKSEQQAIDKANSAMSGLFGNSGGNGSGTTQGDGRQGNPAGKGTSGGNSWSLNGRDLIGSLVKPSYSSNEEGRITVSIRVDKNGIVASAVVVSPTTISDAETRKGAVNAAKRTKFSGGSGVVVGTITYLYRLN
ncbi:MAG: energy transducer TonB [Paludibacteraceae bacterium]